MIRLGGVPSCGDLDANRSWHGVRLSAEIHGTGPGKPPHDSSVHLHRAHEYFAAARVLQIGSRYCQSRLNVVLRCRLGAMESLYSRVSVQQSFCTAEFSSRKGLPSRFSSSACLCGEI